MTIVSIARPEWIEFRCRGHSGRRGQNILFCRRRWLAARCPMIAVCLRWQKDLKVVDLRRLSFGAVRTVWAFLLFLQRGGSFGLIHCGLAAEEVGWPLLNAADYFGVTDAVWDEPCVWRFFEIRRVLSKDDPFRSSRLTLKKESRFRLNEGRHYHGGGGLRWQFLGAVPSSVRRNDLFQGYSFGVDPLFPTPTPK